MPVWPLSSESSKWNHLPDLLYMCSLSFGRASLWEAPSCPSCVSWSASFISNTHSEAQLGRKVELASFAPEALSVMTSVHEFCFRSNCGVSRAHCWAETHQENNHLLYHLLKKVWWKESLTISLTAELNTNSAAVRATTFKYSVYIVYKKTEFILEIENS